MTTVERSTRKGIIVLFVLVVLAAGVLMTSGALRGGTPLGADADVIRLGSPSPVSATSSTAERANNSPVIVADPGDSKFLVLANRLDSPDYSCSLHVSGNGGELWTPVTPVGKLPEGVDKCYGPEVAIDGKGRIHFLFLGLAGQGNLPQGVFLTMSTDRGRTFEPPRRILEGVNFAVRMAIDPTVGDEGRMHIAWLKAGTEPGIGGFNAGGNPILSAHSDDGGRTFSDPVQVNDPQRERVVAPVLALGPEDTVHVGYYDLGDDIRDYQGLDGPVWEGTWELVVNSSTDGGERFAKGVVVEPGVVPHERALVIFTLPPASMAASGDQVCAAWTDGREGDADVFSRCSSDRGRTWAKERRVNDDARASGRWQYLPQLAMAPDGRLDAVFLDRRDDPENLRNDVAYTYSRDGGATFSPQIKLTAAGSSLSTIGQRYAIPTGGPDRYDFGSRLGLVSRPDSALAAWPDTHNSIKPTTAQDIFATAVTPPTQGSGWVVPALGVVLVAVLGMAAVVLRRRRRPTEEPAVVEEPVGEGV